jgi:hypothetical protein
LRRGILTLGEFIARTKERIARVGKCSRKGTKTESLRVLSEHQLHGVIPLLPYLLRNTLTSPYRGKDPETQRSINQFILDSESQPSFPTLLPVELGSLTRIILAATYRSSRVHALFARSTFVEMCMRRRSLDFSSDSVRPSEHMMWDFKERSCFRARAMRQ